MNYFHRVGGGLPAVISAALLMLSAGAAVGQAPAAAAPPGQDAAVTGILATNPTTPRERARAARILADLGRPDLARSFLKLVVDAKLDQQQLAALAEEFGTAMFTEMAGMGEPAAPADVPFHVAIPSFAVSEFRTAFEMGCLLFIPFLLVDLVVAGILLSAGMMMLPPAIISLPFKIILFVLVDGWQLLAKTLVASFQ